MCLVLISSAMAETIVEQTTRAGISPNSPFYFIDVWADNIRLRFTNKIEEKSRLRIEIAEERLAEMEEMAKLKRIESMNKSREQQTKQITEFENSIKLIDDDDTKVLLQKQLLKHIMNVEILRKRYNNKYKNMFNQTLQNSEGVFERNQNRITIQKRQSIDDIHKEILYGKVMLPENSGNGQN